MAQFSIINLKVKNMQPIIIYCEIKSQNISTQVNYAMAEDCVTLPRSVMYIRLYQ